MRNLELIRRLRQHALPDPGDGRPVMHADLLTEAADALVASDKEMREGWSRAERLVRAIWEHCSTTRAPGDDSGGPADRRLWAALAAERIEEVRRTTETPTQPETPRGAPPSVRDNRRRELLFLLRSNGAVALSRLADYIEESEL